MKVHTAIKIAFLSFALVGAVIGWGLNNSESVAASSKEGVSERLAQREDVRINKSLSQREDEPINKSSTHSTSTNSSLRASGSEHKQKSIPTDAIRLRILANSDLEEDQAIKREVRDRVVEMMNGWLQEEKSPSSREEARAMIQEHMEQLTTVANEVLQQNGVSYKAKAELKVVAFPAKLYGGEVYPAGDYEALRITLGAGVGQNWWCVLFPPLCFVDSSQGTAVAKEDGEQSSLSSLEDNQIAEGEASASDSTTELVESSEPEIRFFLWDVLIAIGEFISKLFTAIFG